MNTKMNTSFTRWHLVKGPFLFWCSSVSFYPILTLVPSFFRKIAVFFEEKKIMHVLCLFTTIFRNFSIFPKFIKFQFFWLLNFFSNLNLSVLFDSISSSCYPIFMLVPSFFRKTGEHCGGEKNYVCTLSVYHDILQFLNFSKIEKFTKI